MRGAHVASLAMAWLAVCAVAGRARAQTPPTGEAQAPAPQAPPASHAPPVPYAPPAPHAPAAPYAPPGWSPAPAPAVREYSPGMKYTGIVMTSLGIASFLGSGIAAIAFSTGGPEGSDVLDELFASVGLGLGGLVLTVIGIPLWSVGASDETGATETSPVRAEMWVGPSSGHLVVRF